jgi:hypothetical protein
MLIGSYHPLWRHRLLFVFPARGIAVALCAHCWLFLLTEHRHMQAHRPRPAPCEWLYALLKLVYNITKSEGDAVSTRIMNNTFVPISE